MISRNPLKILAFVGEFDRYPWCGVHVQHDLHVGSDTDRTFVRVCTSHLEDSMFLIACSGVLGPFSRDSCAPLD